ncbi:MAG: ferrous iron transport protein A [Acidobacteria bacterium]|nr:ferrous iron transport protein A [Acidobacteriota bacterium]
MDVGAQGVVVDIVPGDNVENVESGEGRSPSADRLLSLGVTPGARVTMLQRFPGIVFLCDQTELAVERGVANAVLVRPWENPS